MLDSTSHIHFTYGTNKKGEIKYLKIIIIHKIKMRVYTNVYKPGFAQRFDFKIWIHFNITDPRNTCGECTEQSTL